jgi:hypothetical protein
VLAEIRGWQILQEVTVKKKRRLEKNQGVSSRFPAVCNVSNQ